jgi:hypothetical protein
LFYEVCGLINQCINDFSKFVTQNKNSDDHAGATKIRQCENTEINRKRGVSISP